MCGSDYDSMVGTSSLRRDLSKIDSVAAWTIIRVLFLIGVEKLGFNFFRAPDLPSLVPCGISPTSSVAPALDGAPFLSMK